jgi:PAS domain S-box-containing protein
VNFFGRLTLRILISRPFLVIVLVMNHELSRDITDAAQLPDDLQVRLGFETLLADISSNFINLPAGEVDREIEGAQRRVCEFLCIDLSALWQWTPDAPRYITITHLYRPLGGPPPPARIDGEDMAPWCLRELTAGKIVAVSSMKSPPPEAARDVEVWRHYGIKSALCLPLSTGGQLIGALTFNTVREERDWSEVVVNRLTLVAQVFANALARKRAEQALRESEERLHLAADAAGAGLWVLYLETDCFWLTKKTRELFGLTGEADLPLAHFLQFIHPDDRERIREAIQNVQKSGAEAIVEYRTLDSGKGVRWMSSRGRVQLDAAGEPDRLMGVTMDITQRKLVEERQCQLSLAVEQSPASVIITDAQGKIIYANKKFTEVSGYSLAESLGQNPRFLKSGESPPALYQQLWGCLASGKIWRGEFHNRKKNGELYWESAVISPLRNPAGSITHFVAVKEDITGRKRTELELLQQRNQLTHLSRVTMLGELAGSLAHELNQPLTSILSNAQAAQRFLAHGEPDLGEIRDILADIVAEDKRAGEVIRRLRLLLKKGEVQRQPLLVNEIVQEVLKLVRSDLVNLNFTAQTELAPNLPVIHGDAVQLQQVLLNLVLNSCDAMAGATRDNRRLTIRTSRAGDGSVCLTVADGGTGIVPEKLEQVFEPFYTTKASGLGLGLAVCRSIVTAHGGKLWATNNPGHGATFHLTLPVRTDHSR